MADGNHMAQLGRGLAHWNAWRDENVNIRPDLSGAKLGEASLGGANLKCANLSNADLTRTDLRNADLGNADLILAILSGATSVWPTSAMRALVGTPHRGGPQWDDTRRGRPYQGKPRRGEAHQGGPPDFHPAGDGFYGC
jgi:hypothetical protein